MSGQSLATKTTPNCLSGISECCLNALDRGEQLRFVSLITWHISLPGDGLLGITEAALQITEISSSRRRAGTCALVSKATTSSLQSLNYETGRQVYMQLNLPFHPGAEP